MRWDTWVTLVSPSAGLRVLTLAQAVGAASPPLQQETGVQNPWGGTLGCRPLMRALISLSILRNA